MAKGKAKLTDTEDVSVFGTLKRNWNDELCAEHDGTIASFKNLSMTLEDLEDYRLLFERTQPNLLKLGMIAGGVVAGVAVFCPLSYLAAPTVAASLGTTGILGAAGTGTTIATLHGAALTSSSLAAIGGGTMAAGTAVVTAAGAGLGAIQGGVFSNNYYGNVKDFRIEKINEGKGPALVFVNGFLSEKRPKASEWRRAVKDRYWKNPWYMLSWESKALHDLGSLIIKGSGGKAFKTYVTRLAARASRKAGGKLNPLAWATIIADLLSNPWHVATVKSAMTGLLLADLLPRVKKKNFILMGHSLGCRVIYYTLQALSTRKQRCVKDVYLFGGAVQRTDEDGWKQATKAVKGKIYNCHTKNDWVLKCLYRPAQLMSNPIGLGAIKYPSSRIDNWDVSELVNGHLDYMPNIHEIIRQTSLDP